MIKKTSLVTNILKKLWIVFAILIIFSAITSSVFRSLTPWAKQYKGEVEHHLTTLIGQPVTIQTMETGWYWFQPVLRLNQVNIITHNKHALRLDKLLVGINLFKSLWYWQIQPGVLYVDDLDINLREHSGRWFVEGFASESFNENEMSSQKLQDILGWLSRQEKLVLRNISAHFHFSNGTLIPISGLNLSIMNRGGYYRFKGEAKLDQMNATTLKLLGKVKFDPKRVERTQGQIYFAAKHILPAQWQSIFPKMSQRFEGGKGDIALWMDINQGSISSIQAQVNFKRLAWGLLDQKNAQLIQSFFANMKWKPDSSGWSFDADRIQLRMGGVSWPENKLFVKFNKAEQSYQLYIQSILIDALLTTSIHWPAEIQHLSRYKPHGQLTNTQLLFKNNQLSYLLTRFNQIGWNGKKSIPKVNNLSGVLSWQPEQGRLEIDSENTTVDMMGYPTQYISLLNGAFTWSKVPNGLQITIERGVLSQPQLTISAEGSIEKMSSSELGQLNLNIDFSGKNLQQWLPYLPAHTLKPKLAYWLKHNIKRIAQASGKIRVHGQAKDFPFDNNQGEFSLISHASGGDLFITSQWKLIKNIESYIRLHNRNLEFDIVHADFQGATAKQVHLRIDEIGKDKETLLLHGVIDTSAQKMLDFVLASPLKKKLSALQSMLVKGNALLNLRLEVPLYPENNEVLVQGNLLFKDNTILLKHQMAQMAVDQLNGELDFSENGISESRLVGRAFDNPMSIHIQSEDKPYSHTKVSIDGECPVSALKTQWNWPLLNVLQGSFFVNVALDISNNPNDLGHLVIQSNLKGMAVNLPSPLGKLAHEKALLLVKVDYGLKNNLHLKAKYANQLSADLLLIKRKESLDFKSGEIRLGNKDAINRNKKGLSVTGDLHGFDLESWKKVYPALSNNNSENLLLKKLDSIHVKLDQLNFLNQHFNNVLLHARQLSDNKWSFNIEQRDLNAQLEYDSESNLLSGHFKRLHLARIKSSGQDIEQADKLHPDQIPNLDVQIDHLSIGQINLGSMILKSKSSPKQWQIDTCRIESPVYQFNINGDWIQKEKTNQTHVEITLLVNDLAKSLERWQITPAVNAGKGEMAFNGGWKGSLFDFSLEKLSGTMSLKLKKGIITHLSRETEEKLGLGKLLSILSLQTIPRRLTLDFSDLSHDGYSFDVFKGSYDIKKGIMSTTDSYLDGPVAYASMKGDLDLVKRLYDLDLQISPHITASLPVVATIAGGPVAGIAAWLANKIINQGMQKISAYRYKISGPWSEPVIKQLSIIKKR